MGTLGTPNKPHVELLMEDGKLQLFEGRGTQQGKMMVRGEFGRSDKPTANGRLYPPSLWETQFGRLAPNLEKRKVLGELDHPTDGKTSLQRASHVVTNLKLENGVVIGEAEILNTRVGKDLQELLKAGIPVGISSRGYGSTKKDVKTGWEVVEDDYKLVTFDFVAEPADPDATPRVFYEHVEPFMSGEKEQDLAKKFAAKILATNKDDKDETGEEELESFLLKNLSKLKATVREEVEKELLADPSVAAAKEALEKIREIVGKATATAESADDKDKKIADLEKQLEEKDALIEKLADATKEAGYRYRLEQLILNDEDADVIRKSVGDVTLYDSVEELEERIDKVRQSIDAKRAEEDRFRQEIKKRESKLQSENEELSEALEQAVETNKQIALQLYLERRLRNHPQADKIRTMFEHGSLTSKKQIDALIEKFRVPTRSSADLEEIRHRVRRTIGSSGASEYLEEDNEDIRRSSSDGDEDYNGLGASLQELKHLSGINN